MKEDCFREGFNEKFFVYSTDGTQIFALAEAAGRISLPLNVTHGVVGKTWQGMELSITQGNTSITEAGGKPLTITSPNSALTYMCDVQVAPLRMKEYTAPGSVQPLSVG